MAVLDGVPRVKAPYVAGCGGFGKVLVFAGNCQLLPVRYLVRALLQSCLTSTLLRRALPYPVEVALSGLIICILTMFGQRCVFIFLFFNLFIFHSIGVLLSQAICA